MLIFIVPQQAVEINVVLFLIYSTVEYSIMTFIEHAALSDLNESRYDWTICVRTKAIWQGVNM